MISSPLRQGEEKSSSTSPLSTLPLAESVCCGKALKNKDNNEKECSQPQSDRLYCGNARVSDDAPMDFSLLTLDGYKRGYKSQSLAGSTLTDYHVIDVIDFHIYSPLIGPSSVVENNLFYSFSYLYLSIQSPQLQAVAYRGFSSVESTATRSLRLIPSNFLNMSAPVGSKNLPFNQSVDMKVLE